MSTIDKRNNTRPIILIGYAIILVFVGVLGGWAAFAPLDKAVIAPGHVEVDTDRIEVQHLEGGIIKEVAVKEGDPVMRGDVLVTMEDVQARANLQVIDLRLRVAGAEETRLDAERQLLDELVFPAQLLRDASPDVLSAIEDQRRVFADQRSILTSEVDILRNRIAQLHKELEGLEGQREAFQSRADILLARLDRLRPGLETGAVTFNQFSTYEEQYVEVQSNVANMVTEQAKAQTSIGEAEFQILQARQRFRERASTEYNDLSGEIQELREQRIVALDVLERTDIRAPIDGVAQNVRTSGRVIRPGQVLLELVPESENMIINARVSPLDIDNVHAGLEAEVRFTAFPGRKMPIILGQVDTVSRGTITPENPQEEPYFLAVVNVDKTAVPADVAEKLSAGMPADVMISTGERTVLDYLVSPLTEAVRNSMREE